MKILQIGSSLKDWGGIERYTTYLIDGLIERGHDLELTAPKGSPLDTRARGKHHGIRLGKQFDLRVIPAYRKLFAANKYDVVHIQFSPDYIIPAKLANSSKQPCIIMTRHVGVPWSPSKRERYLSYFHHIIAVSEAVRTSLIKESGVPAERVTTAYAGCPSVQPKTDRNEVRKRLNVSGFAMGFFGRLTPEKGVATLIEAANRLPESVSVHIFGEGPLLSALKEHPGSRRVRFEGFVPDVADAMNAMDGVVIPSIWAEAFPYSALEAMSIGKPIVASNVGGLPEQVIQSQTGLLVPKEDPKSLADAIQSLSNDPGKAIAMGLAGQAIQQGTFTVPLFAERIESVYNRVRESRN